MININHLWLPLIYFIYTLNHVENGWWKTTVRMFIIVAHRCDAIPSVSSSSFLYGFWFLMLGPFAHWQPCNLTTDAVHRINRIAKAPAKKHQIAGSYNFWVIYLYKIHSCKIYIFYGEGEAKREHNLCVFIYFARSLNLPTYAYIYVYGYVCKSPSHSLSISLSLSIYLSTYLSMSIFVYLVWFWTIFFNCLVFIHFHFVIYFNHSQFLIWFFTLTNNTDEYLYIYRNIFFFCFCRPFNMLIILLFSFLSPRNQRRRKSKQK